MFKIGGVVIWITLFAMVLSSIIRSEKINATPHSVGQLHHTGKTIGFVVADGVKSGRQSP